MLRRLIDPDLRPWTMLALALVPILGLVVGAAQFWLIERNEIHAATHELGALDDAVLVHKLSREIELFEMTNAAIAVGFMDPEAGAAMSLATKDRLAEIETEIDAAFASDRSSLHDRGRDTIQRSLTDLERLREQHVVGKLLTFEERNALARDKHELEQLWNRIDFALDDPVLADRIEAARFLHNYTSAYAAEQLAVMRNVSGASDTEAVQIADIAGASAVRGAAFDALVASGHNPFVDDPQYAGSDPAASFEPWTRALLNRTRHDLVQWFSATNVIVEDASATIAGLLGELNTGQIQRIASAKQDRTTNAILGVSVLVVAGALLMVTRREVSDRRRVERAHKEAIDDLVVRAERDSLTGLWNRTRIENHLPTLLEHQHECPLVLAYVDLDEFKPVNDIWGHHHGDEVLKFVARRLTTLVPDDFEVVRFGGDEFVVFGRMPGADLPAVSDFGRRIVNEIAAPMKIDGRRWVVEATVGLSLTGLEDAPDSDLLLEADAALILAKKRQRGSALVYDRELRRDAMLLRALPEALDHDQICAHFQPAYNIETGRCVGVEALARWTRENGEMVSPGEFIPLVESYGLMGRLTENMLRQVAIIQQEPDMPRDCRIWLNVSAVELDTRDFAERFIQLALVSHVQMSRIGVEITETAAIRNPKNLAIALESLRAAGAMIAIDDFGNGYSPLGFLRDIPFDVLKLDRSLVSDIDTKTDMQVIVQGIVSMMAEYDVEVVAEGIERTEEFKWLASIGVQTAQGFLLARPMPKDDLLAMIRQPSHVALV